MVDFASIVASMSNWYTGDATFDFVQALELALVSSVPLGAFLKSPYGKHSNNNLGSIQLNPKFGWWLMELPATVAFVVTYFYDRFFEKAPAAAQVPSAGVSMFLAGLFIFHYGYRGWYFPLNIRVAKDAKASFSLTVSGIGAVFTAMHGYLHARLYASLGAHLTSDWIYDPRFLIGFSVYELGFWTMVHADYVVRNLRSLDGSGPRYKIPYGGGFKFVTSPQYMGEITAFAGLAIMNWSLPGLAVVLITSFNLVPRAFQNQTWYHEKFPDEYAKLNRKVIIPFLL